MPLTKEDLAAIEKIIDAKTAPIIQKLTHMEAQLDVIGNWIPYNSTIPNKVNKNSDGRVVKTARST
jgi:hypothetical protein